MAEGCPCCPSAVPGNLPAMSHPLTRPNRAGRSTSQAERRWVPEPVHAFLGRVCAGGAGAGLALVGIAFALATLSYDSRDPSWNTAAPVGRAVHNMLGGPGASVADLARQCFGLSSLSLTLILVAWGWRIAARQGLGLITLRLVAAVLAFVVLGTAGALWTAEPSSMDLWGGAIGHVLGRGLRTSLPPWSTPLVTLLLGTLGLGALVAACALDRRAILVLLRTAHAAGRWLGRQTVAGVRRLLQRLRAPRTWEEGDDAEETGDGTGLKRRSVEGHDTERTDDPETESHAFVRGDLPTSHDPATRETKILRLGHVEKRTPKTPSRVAPPPPRRVVTATDGAYAVPPLDLLGWPESAKTVAPGLSPEALDKNAKMLEGVLADFGVHGHITRVSPGPVVTLYELEPSPGTRASRVISLADDIARNMSATSVRVAVVPGRNVIGIELPNRRRETVYLREILASRAYNEHPGTLPLVLGKDISGAPIIVDLARMPHLLIAGTTGSGKSVGLNTMILSLIYLLPPQRCRFIMIDPKMLELSMYEGIPHLLAPAVTEPRKAIRALKWTVREMEDRYRKMSKLGVRNIEGYNARLREASRKGERLTRLVQPGFDPETGKPLYEEQALDLAPLAYIVVIVDEMADLMLVAGKDIEGAVQRLAQMARAAGIHLIMATQRPSVDVITGTIKANFPTRVSFQVTSKIDSRTILGEQGAEQLLGQGDMLYMAGGGRVTRVHGPFVRDEDVESVVAFLKSQGGPDDLMDITADDSDDEGSDKGESGDDSGGNELYDKAVDLVLRERKASISFVQRHLQIGYNRAATLIERMEREGVVGEANHVGKREVLGRKP